MVHEKGYGDYDLGLVIEKSIEQLKPCKGKEHKLLWYVVFRVAILEHFCEVINGGIMRRTNVPSLCLRGLK